MIGGEIGRDARVLALLSAWLPGPKGNAPAPLGVAEWRRIGSRLREGLFITPRRAVPPPGAISWTCPCLRRSGRWVAGPLASHEE